MRRLLCLLTLAVWLWAPGRVAHADERGHLWLSLPPAVPPPELDDDLPDLDAILDPSRAEPEPPVVVEEPRWYGRTLMLADGASVAVLLAGASSGSGRMWDIGLAGMLVSGPAVHAWHGHLERGGVGLLMRFGGAVLGSLVAGAAGGDEARAAGAITGYLGAVAFDGLYLCHDTVERRAPPESELGPDLSLAGSGATLGIHGSF
jgi:hypothetical protein